MDKSQLQPSSSRLLLEYCIYTLDQTGMYTAYMSYLAHMQDQLWQDWVLVLMGQKIMYGVVTANPTLKLTLLNCSAELVYQTVIAFIFQTTTTVSVVDSI